MRELLYIHASAGYLASHFFNTQQSYITVDVDSDSVPIAPDISFNQSLAPDGTTIFCPRLLLFDNKSRFGSVAHINALYSGEDEARGNPMWAGPVTQHRQDPITQSTYHARLDAGEDEDEDENDDTEMIMDGQKKVVRDFTPSIRFWSDFSRVYYHPRGLHRVPDPLEWQREIGWAHGAERFALYDAEHSVLEDSFRMYAEECDLLQGIQLSLDAPRFGSFIVSLLSQFRDEYPKLPLLSFCSLSRYDPAQLSLDDIEACVGALNDALTLHELASLSTVTVPLQCPATWRRGQWCEHLNADFTKPYHSSALLAAQIETATLPLRLNPSAASSTDLASFCAQLTWRGNTPFASLSGAFPMPSSPSQLDKYCFDYSHPELPHQAETATPFAQRDVFRGLDSRETEIVQKVVEETQTRSGLREPFLSTFYFDMPYPINSSHPQFFIHLTPTGRGILSPSSPLSSLLPPLPLASPSRVRTFDQTRVRSLPVYTSLRTTPKTGTFIRQYAQFVERARKRGVGVAEVGVESEMLDEVREQFWTWRDEYMGEEDEDEGEWGEDEKDVV